MRERALPCLSPHGFHRMTYYEWGDPANPNVVICVHGLTRNGRDFDELARALSADYRVLCPDVPGRGKSEWLPHKEDYSYPVYCADMAALIARSGAQSVDWVGTSMGGLIGMLLAAQPNSPIRKLVMNDVGPFIPKASLERLATYVGKPVSYDSFDAFEQYIRTLSASFGPLTDAQWRHLAQTTAIRKEDGRWGTNYDPAISLPFTGPIADVVLWPFWDKIRAPTLLLRGKESDLLLGETAHDMTTRGPKAKLVEFAGIGHAPMLMAADQINVVRQFLLGQGAEKRGERKEERGKLK
jgi:pimeloyl-ACP methyl ester carboxylesterase